MTPLTFVELFAGVGGMSRGLELAGWRCVGHAEIEPFPRQVLAHHWSDIPLWGDVSTLNGHDIVREVGPFQMLTFGAPCQDFSIAGTRQGLAGDRSSLVHHALRIWEESGAPFALYENVVGMLSSNHGADFAAILSAIVGADVAVPAARWKGGTGVVSGPAGVAAWRTLDGRFFGVPQRRRRVFVLAARTGSGRGREVLSLLESLSGYPEAECETREADSGAVAGVAGGSGTGVIAFKIRGGVERDSGGKMAGKGYLGTTDEVFTIGTAQDQHIFDARAVNISGGIVSLDEEMGTLGTRSGGSEVGAQTRGVIFDARGNGDGQTCNTLAGDRSNRVTDYTPIVVDKHSGGGGKPGQGFAAILEPIGFRMVAFGEYDQDGSASAIKQRDYKDATDLVLHGPRPRPRRLTPLECERLMGWPDRWTALPGAKDTPRYKACGNGVMSPVAGWIGWRLRAAIEAEDLLG